MRWAILGTVLALTATSPALADPWKDESGKGRSGGEWSQSFRDGNCTIERKQERDGEYKEEIKCRGVPSWAQGVALPGGSGKQEYRVGNCKIERKWERGGEYKEEVKCDGPPPWLQAARAAPVAPSQPWANPAPAQPPLPPGLDYGDAYRDAQGRYCREYRTTGYIDGRQEDLYGHVCLQPDGSWAFNN